MTVAVVIPSLPERGPMLAEALRSVACQTRPADEIHVAVDLDRAGAPATRNRGAVTGAEWLAFLDDDDLLYPHHLETLLAHDADVIYGYCDVAGSHGFDHNLPFDADALRHHNYIPVTTLVRTEAFRDVGGFRDVDLEDWDLWLRLLDAGATFQEVPEVTWTYRFHSPTQRTFNGR